MSVGYFKSVFLLNLWGQEMGDFERTYGAGADFDRIIDENNSEYFREERQKAKNSKKEFSSFQDALAWAKANPGKTIVRSPDGVGFIEK
ncbi:TPA: hypothetical protein NWA23_004187 [Escherichia coli]|uniref:hypothetical protein n=2 Tax=Escherichia coli TaxID=562 RepID=UPI0013AE8CFB|nr:hypothetical protein [Escherichia coli]HDG7853279.1 hypothetical protein [Klebsiella quasipneumoniae]EJC0159876.1 hypothetical protein [Escherichia coli]MCR6274658.1 hypothetical protein [Escherichia coli]HCJ5678082.1 hypothetical protein [Escherichia coli]HCJ9912797.1 hypothetical protein [Escherichia coli]